ncbi:non-ribosomal peptide synthetase [Micromonospora marina]|uniref:non-ribosomal peptide synthetase n=1 Tax=Micromonospora marina TaxID=307120 RepID=UPI003D712DB5
MTISTLPSASASASTRPGTWLVERIRARAADRDPAICDAPALRTSQAEVTYAALWDRAQGMGCDLSALGVRAGDIVAVQMTSSPDVVVAMLASWLAGAAFLPMDATVPHDYRDHLLTASRAAAIVDDQGARSLTDGTPRRAAGPADRLAYIIYTSGSTGVPKGVLVGHDALASHTAAMVDLLGLRPGDTVPQFAGLGFDVAQEEIWPTLAVGGTVAFLDSPARALGPAELARHVRDLGVSILQLPTAYWRLICAQTQTTESSDLSFAGVRTVVIGGEGASTKDARAHRAGPLAHCALVNAYGPTETVVTCTAFVLQPDEPVPATAGLPIGDAVADRQVYVLDADGLPAAPATPGELWIGGGPLADGYLDDPVRTAERFQADPFAATTSGRMYRTGDLVVRHPGGELEFLGRLDNQVKVRGYRIELDEVEQKLLHVPGVTAAAATAPDDGVGGRTLLAAVSVTSNGPTAHQILEHLRGCLPRHMVPARVDIHDQLPTTTSGKIDRRAVAAMATDRRAALEEVESSPGTDALDVLVRMVRTTLRVPDFGADDDFLASGGDSLAALRVSGSLRELGWRLRASDLMSEKDARAVATRITRV